MKQQPGAREERHETKTCLWDEMIVGEKRHETKPSTQCKGRTAWTKSLFCERKKEKKGKKRKKKPTVQGYSEFLTQFTIKICEGNSGYCIERRFVETKDVFLTKSRLRFVSKIMGIKLTVEMILWRKKIDVAQYKNLHEKRTRPIAISCVLRANSDRRTDGWTDKAAYRVACTRLKNLCGGQ